MRLLVSLWSGRMGWWGGSPDSAGNDDEVNGREKRGRGRKDAGNEGDGEDGGQL
jgi:hypothetical protein